MISNIIIKIVSGASVGYITNDLAVKMLFRKYFGLGGVIIKTRHEFIQNISQLVENDIIHHAAIEKEIKGEPFRNVLDQFIKDFFENKLLKIFPPDLLVGDIPAYGSALELLKKTFYESIEYHSPNIINSFISKIDWNEIITEKQIDKISKELTKISFDFIKEHHLIKDLIATILTNWKEISIQELLGTENTRQLTINISNLFKDIHLYLKYNYEDQIKEIIQNILKQLSFDEIIDHFSEFLSKQSIEDLVGASNSEALPSILTNEIQQIFQSEVGQDMVEVFLRFLLKLIKKEKYTVFELLSPDLQQNLERFFAEELPDLMQNLITWIQTKKDQIDELIDETFKDNNKYILQDWLVDLFVGSVSESAEIVNQIIGMISKQEPKTLAKQATDQLLNYLKTNTIADFLAKMSEQSIVQNVAPIVLMNLEKPLKNLPFDDIVPFLKQPIESIIEQEQITGILKKTILQFLESDFLLSPRLSEFIQNQLTEKLTEWSQRKISHWISDIEREKFSENLEKTILEILSKNQSQVEQFVFESVHQLFEKNKPEEILKAVDKKMPTDFVITRIKDWLDMELKKIGSKPIQEYLIPIQQISNLQRRTSDYIFEAILKNLPVIVEGRVANLVRENLERLEDDRIRDMVYNVMGKELQPISIFGAFLGAITGGILLVLPVFDNFWLNTSVAGLAYGITGWGTNWLAIKMIFRPYTKWTFPILKFRIPFTPGVIAKNKNRFAQSMSRFLGDRILNQDNVKRTLNNQETHSGKKKIVKTKNFIREFLGQNDYAFLKEQIQNNKSKIALPIVKLILDFIIDKKQILSEGLNKVLQDNRDIKLKDFNIKGLESNIQAYLSNPSIPDTISNSVSSWMHDHGKTVLWSMLPQNMKEGLYNSLDAALINQINSFIDDFVEKDKLLAIQDTLLEKTLNFLDQNIDTLLDQKQKGNLKQKVFNILHDKLRSEELRHWIFEKILQRISEETSDEKRIKDVFGGKILSSLEENTSFILQKIISQGLEWLENNKNRIADEVYDLAVEKNIGAFAFEGTIRRSIVDLTENRLPSFFTKEFRNLNLVIKQKISQLGNLSIKQIGVNFNNNNLQSKIDLLLNNPSLQKLILQLSELLVDERLFKLKLNTFLNDDKAQIKTHLSNLLQPELNWIQEKLIGDLKDESKLKLILEEPIFLFKEILEKLLQNYTVDALLKDIPHEEIDRIVQQNIRSFFEQEQSKSYLEKAAHDLIPFLEDKKLNDLLDFDLLNASLGAILQGIIEDTTNQESIKTFLNEVLEFNLNELIQNLPDKTKDYLIKRFVDLIFITLENNLIDIIQSVDLKKIVVEEVGAMHPVELENLFYGFAASYFKKLIDYGFGFGIVFGLAVDWGLLLITWLFIRLVTQ